MIITKEQEGVLLAYCGKGPVLFFFLDQSHTETLVKYNKNEFLGKQDEAIYKDVQNASPSFCN